MHIPVPSHLVPPRLSPHPLLLCPTIFNHHAVTLNDVNARYHIRSMKATVFANGALFVATAAAYVRLPFGYRPTASATQDPDVEVSIVSLAYSVNVTIGTPPQEVSLLLSMGGDLSHVPDLELCAASPDVDICPLGSCECGASLPGDMACFPN